jgi:hypothetical protein
MYLNKVQGRRAVLKINEKDPVAYTELTLRLK